MLEIDIIEQNIADISLDLLKILLTDKTTRKYIRWGSDNYTKYGSEYSANQEIRPELIIGDRSTVIQPRVSKKEEEQTKRTRDKAEVFTPSWVCNEQNNLVDEAWFGRQDVFNTAGDKCWTTHLEKIEFSGEKTWMSYVDARRMEVSCGEAPYLVSRYDTVTGEIIPLHDRIGILDRKIRIVNENASTDDEWKKWAERAFQSCYGYDFQGDNVLLARENLLYSYQEYYEDKFGQTPTVQELKRIAQIAAWNIWQMNGLTLTTPYSLAPPVQKQMSLFDMLGQDDNDKSEKESNELPCKIFDWRSKESLEFRSLVNRG